MLKMKKVETRFTPWNVFLWLTKIAELSFYAAAIILIAYIATFMPTIKTISSSVGGVFYSAEMYARENGMTATDFTRMVAPRNKEAGVAFATAMRDIVVEGGQFVQAANERNAAELLENSNKLLRIVRPEQVRLLSSVMEKQILNGNVDKIIDFMAASEDSSLVGKLYEIADGDFVRGMNVFGEWMQKNETRALLDQVSSMPFDVLMRDVTLMLDDMQKYNMASTLSKLASVLVKMTTALQESQ